MNPDFSSTPGVQMAMARFNEVIYDPSTETVVGIGVGGSCSVVVSQDILYMVTPVMMLSLKDSFEKRKIAEMASARSLQIL